MSATPPDKDRPALAGYYEQFGDRFHDAIVDATSPRRRRKGRRWGAVLVAVASLATVLLATMMSGPPSQPTVNLIDEAQAALAPPGAIVHMTVTSTSTDGSSSASRTVEQWSAANPTRWRLVQTIEEPSTGSIRDFTGATIQGREEFSYADGLQRRFLARRNVLDVRRSIDTRGPGVFGLPNGGDPAAELRAALAAGTVTDEGERHVGEQTVRRLTGVQGTGMETRTFTYDVDRETFAPVHGQLQLAKAHEVMFSFHVDSYERLPLTPENAALLRISTNSATTIRGQEATARRHR